MRIRLNDGSFLRCEVEWPPCGLFIGKPLRVTYYHGDTVISLEGARYLSERYGGAG